MTYNQIFTTLTKRQGVDHVEIRFARRLSWPPNILIYYGWTKDNRTNSMAGLCVSNEKGSSEYEPTEADFKAEDWTLDPWGRGDQKMGLSYFEVKRQLRNANFCYAVRDGWDDEHPVLSYDINKEKFILTDFQEELEWKPELEDIQTRDWTVSRFLL